MLPKFLQIHTLHSYTGVLINRDQDGLAKRLQFGPAIRTRVSSQCLKHHLRHFGKNEGAGLSALADMGIRSRDIFKVLRDEAIENGVDPERAEAATLALMDVVMQKKKKGADDKQKAKPKKGAKAGPQAETEDGSDETDKGWSDESDPLKMKQAITLARTEVIYLGRLLREVAATEGDQKSYAATFTKLTSKAGGAEGKNVKTLVDSARSVNGGLESALFGRFITSDIFTRVDGAVHVAHSMTVHREQSETDFCTVADDLDPVGSAGMFETEINSGLFYGYVCIDIAQLVMNLTGCKREDWENVDKKLAGQVIATLIELLCTTSPAAKKGSTAPYTRAEMMLVEIGNEQPYQFAGGFRKPVTARADEDILDNTVVTIGNFIGEMENMYGATTNHRLLMAPTRLQRAVPGAKAANMRQIIDEAARTLTSTGA